MANPIVTITMEDGAVMRGELYPEIVEVEGMVAKLAPPLGGKGGRVSVTLKG